MACSIGRLEIVDVQHLTGPGGLGKARQKAFSSVTAMFSRWRPPLALGLSALIPPWS
jgi:hypothetical protein